MITPEKGTEGTIYLAMEKRIDPNSEMMLNEKELEELIANEQERMRID